MSRRCISLLVAFAVGVLSTDAVAAKPADLATSQKAPGAAASDGTRIYWVAGDAVMSAPIAGGAPTTAASNLAYPAAVAVDATHVFWVDAGGAVMKAPKAGGAAVTIVSGVATIGTAMGMAVDDTDIYWTRAVTKISSNQVLGSVMKVAKTGGAPTTIAADQESPWSIALTKDTVVWTNYAMWTSGSMGAIRKAPKSGGAVVTIASADHPAGLATDGNSVFWSDWSKGTVMKAPLAGGAPTTLANGETNPLGVAADATDVYWTTCYAMSGPPPCAGAIKKVPKTGGTVVQVASSQVNPYAIVLDGSHVFWTARGAMGATADGAVRSMTK